MDDLPVAPSRDSQSRKPCLAPAAPHGGPSSAAHNTPAQEPPRRSFLMEAAAAVIGGIVALVPLAAGVMTYLDPLRRVKPKASAVPITTLDALPDVSQGDKFIGIYKITANRQDAWNLYPNEPIGSVYLVGTKGKDGKTEIKALNATCPHLGCFVDKVDQPNDKYSFYCPCHTSAFQSNGERVMPCVAPRGMDVLECVVSPPAADGKIVVSVAYQNFQPGLTDKKPKT